MNNIEDRRIIISNLADLSKNITNIFFIYISFIVYCGITVLSIKDEQLTIKNVTIHLPILNSDINIIGFFFGSSIISILIYIYLNLNLLRLKILTKDLLLLHPNLNNKYLYPGFFNFLVYPKYSSVNIIQKLIVNLIEYWSLPIINLLLSVELVKAHNYRLSLVSGLFPCIATGFVVYFGIILENKKIKFNLKIKEYFNLKNIDPTIFFLFLIILLTTIRYYLVFYPGSISGKEVVFLQNIIEASNILDLSGKNLVSSDVQCNRQIMENFINANFQGANLKSAVLKNANLQGASFERAKLHFTNLECTDLRKVNFKNTDFFHPNLSQADLRRVDMSASNNNLKYTNFEGADLYKAILQNTELENANFKDARLTEANLQGAKGIKPEQICESYNLHKTQLDNPLLTNTMNTCKEKFDYMEEGFNRKFPFR